MKCLRLILYFVPFILMLSCSDQNRMVTPNDGKSPVIRETKMISWQCRLIKQYLRIKHLLYPSTGKFDVAKKRENLDSLGQKFKTGFDLKSKPVVVGGVPAERIVPSGALTNRVILYLHGGGYSRGSITSHRTLAANIANAASARAFVINYRLASENPYPAALEDAMIAYRWLLTNHISPNQIAVAGDSAGGGLTLSLLVALRDAGDPLPAAAVCLSPFTDLAVTGESFSTKADVEFILDPEEVRESAKLYLGDASPYTPLASPLYADLKNLPPILIQVGKDEILLSDSSRFAERAEAAGNDIRLEIWEGMFHVWQFSANILPEGRQAIERIGKFLDKIFIQERVNAKAKTFSDSK